KLKDLQKEMEILQKETIEEETALADFKRKKLRAALLSQLDALFEFGEKLIILTKHSKDIVEEIPVNDTHPGQEKTSQIVSSAIKALEEWAPPPPEKFPAYLQRSQVTASEDSQEESLTTSHPGYVIMQPSQDAPNTEKTEFPFATYKQKTFPTTSTSTENMSSNAKYYDDPNEADHSDLDQTTDADQELETPKKFWDVITHQTKDSITENTITTSFHAIQTEGVPRPPTPPISHAKSVSPEGSESPESNQVTQSEDQAIAPSSTLDTPSEIQILQPTNPTQNDSSVPSAEVSEPYVESSEPSIEVSEPPIEMPEASTSPQNETSSEVYLSDKTHKIHNHQKRVHFSDVEDEIP
ncbi:3252_t:CDS:2, partial [Acaulospora colombiana]